MKTPFFSSRQTVPFGHRRTAPHVGVVDSKPHIRTFLVQMLEDLGFVAHQCDRSSAVAAASTTLGAGSCRSWFAYARERRHQIAARAGVGRLSGQGHAVWRTCVAGAAGAPRARRTPRPCDVAAVADAVSRQGSAGKPFGVSADPFGAERVHRCRRSRSATDGLSFGISRKSICDRCRCAAPRRCVRVRHPVVGDCCRPRPSFRAQRPTLPGAVGIRHRARDRGLDQFRQGAAAARDVGSLADVGAREIRHLSTDCACSLPDHSAYAKLTIEINSIDVGRDPALARKAARQLETHNVAISIDDVMAEASWVDVGDFPIAELQVDPNFINGCAGDRHKRTACGMVLSIAERLGARTTAKGIESPRTFERSATWDFDLGQGALFAKPMDADKFARTMLRA